MENLLFKKDGVYVVIPEIAHVKQNEVKNDPNLVYHYDYKYHNVLYGGRVELKFYTSEELFFIVDGIYIEQYGAALSFSSSLNIGTVAAYLNQIENLGVDTFLENYKAQMQAMKEQLNEVGNQLAAELAVQEDAEKSKMLADIRKALLSLICLICTLSIHMNAGLDNYKYIDAAESVMTQYCN